MRSHPETLQWMWKNHTSHPYGIQSSAKTALQPGITHAKVHLRSHSTERLLTKDVAKATLWLLKFGHQQAGCTEWRESCLSRRAFYLKPFMSTYFPSAALMSPLFCTFQEHNRTLRRLCYMSEEPSALVNGEGESCCL